MNKVLITDKTSDINNHLNTANKKLITKRFFKPYLGIHDDIFINIKISAITPNDQIIPIAFVLYEFSVK